MMKVLKDSFYHKLHAMSATFRLESPSVKVENGKIFVTTEDGSKIYYTDIRTGKTAEYKAPLNADMAPFVTFRSELMTGYSNDVGAPAYYKPRTPKATLTSSMAFSAKRNAEQCASYKGVAYTTRCAKSGDWAEFRFEEPLRCQYLKVATGYPHLHRCLIYKGHIEVCYDGKKFVKAGNLRNGYFELKPNKKSSIHAIRIVADGISDAEDKVIFQPLVIK